MGSGKRTMGLGLPADGLSPWDVSANYAVALSGYVTNLLFIRSWDGRVFVRLFKLLEALLMRVYCDFGG